MPNHVLAAWMLTGALLSVGLLTGPFERRAYGGELDPRRKLTAYGATMAVLWAFALAAIAICGWAPLLRSPAAATAWLPAPAIVGPGLAVIAGAYVLFALLPALQSVRGERWRAAYAAAIRKAFAHLPGFLPNTGAERGAFVLVSLTAGVCEEILFRGFLIRFLHEGGLALPILGALAASSLAFGLGHAYQGVRGVAMTTVAGLVMGVLFLLSGSLIPVMIVHALLDLQTPYVLRPRSGVGDAATARAA